MTAVADSIAAPATAADERQHGGRTGALLLTGSGFPASGLLFVAAYSSANRGGGYVHELFWAAVALALLTTGGTFALARDKRTAAAVLTVVLALLFSLPKFLRSPQYFDFYDELAHLQATTALLQGHSPFATNPLNKVVGDYPGLSLVTAATSAVTGTSVFAAGNVVILLARLAGSLAVFLLAERLVRRPVAALIGVLIFMSNPAFMFFDAQFAYESLALPLATVVVLLALRLADDGRGRSEFLAAAVLSLAVVVTHHATSYVLAALLVLMVVRARRRASGHLVALCCFNVVAIAVWLFGVGRYTLTYIGPYLRSNLTSIPDLLTGSSKPRHLFGGGLPIPAYERVASFAAIAILAGLYAVGGWSLLRDRARRSLTGVWVFLCLGASLFVSLPLVAVRQDQVAKRIWEFAFVGLAPVCAIVLVRWLARDRARIAIRLGVAAALMTVFVGNGVMRSGEHIRFPGPYAPSADPRSMTPDVIAAARWLEQTYGPGHRIVGDRTLAATMGSYGDQLDVTYQEDGTPVWKIFFPDTLTPAVTQELRRSGTQWIAVDLRSAGKFPLTGYYFDESEPGAYVSTHLSRDALTKFDHGPFRRVYDNGHIVLYEVIR